MSQHTNATTTCSVRTLLKTRHMIQRQEERGISDALISETLRDGLVLDEKGSRKLHVSDYVVVISDCRKGKYIQRPHSNTGITTFRHKLFNELRAVSSTDLDGNLRLNTSYVFQQQNDSCYFVGKIDKTNVELGFGVQFLKDSCDDSLFEMVALVCSRHSLTLECFPMRLEKVLSRRASASKAIDQDSNFRAASQASTRHKGRIQTSSVVINGQETCNVAIFRSLIATRPTGRIARWVEYDTEENVPNRPSFSMNDVQHALADCTFQLPQLSGRWRLDEMGDYSGISVYTLLAFPLGPAQEDGATRCLVLALQSNDEEEGEYERFGVGRGILGRLGPEPLHVTLTIRRIHKGRPNDQKARLEVLHGSYRQLSRSTGFTLSRIDPPTAGATSGTTSESSAASDLPLAGGPPSFDTPAARTSRIDAAATAADLQQAEKLLAHFLPDPLPLDEAVWAGDTARVAAVAQSVEWPALRGQRIEAGGAWEGQVEPMLAAALHGRADVVALLLGDRRLGDLRTFDLACLGAVLGDAAVELLARVAREPGLRRAHCTREDGLSDVGLEGCGLAAAAAACGGGPLAQELARVGCDYDVFAAVLAGDAEWVHALKADDERLMKDLDSPFPGWAENPGVKVRGLRPLMAAVLRRDLPMVRALVAKRDCEYNLFAAVLAGDVEWVCALKEDDERLSELDRPLPSWAQKPGLLPLMVAVQRGDLPMVKALIAKGANPFALRENQDSTAINYAQVYDHHDADDFPILSAVLAAAQLKGLPEDWRDSVLERCEKWMDATHPKALAKLVNFEHSFEVDLQAVEFQPGSVDLSMLHCPEAQRELGIRDSGDSGLSPFVPPVSAAEPTNSVQQDLRGTAQDPQGRFLARFKPWLLVTRGWTEAGDFERHNFDEDFPWGAAEASPPERADASLQALQPSTPQGLQGCPAPSRDAGADPNVPPAPVAPTNTARTAVGLGVDRAGGRDVRDGAAADAARPNPVDAGPLRGAWASGPPSLPGGSGGLLRARGRAEAVVAVAGSEMGDLLLGSTATVRVRAHGSEGGRGGGGRGASGGADAGRAGGAWGGGTRSWGRGQDTQSCNNLDGREAGGGRGCFGDAR